MRKVHVLGNRILYGFKSHIANSKSKSIAKGALLLSSSLPVYGAYSKFSVEDNEAVASAYGMIRFLRSLSVGLWISFDYYFSMMGLNESNPNFQVMMSRIHERAANNILNACLRNGGCYIKLGQGLVSLSHILPREYISTLKVLQDKCLIREGGELMRIFQEDFGKNPLEMFKTIDETPIASASIAQVYKAETHNDETVAVKIQYIDLKKRFFKDIQTVTFLLKIAGWMHPDFDFSWILSDLKETLEQELDFVNEGRNSEKCAKDLGHLNYIHVPKVFWDYCSQRILVTEFIDGIKISEIEELRKHGFSLVDINNKLFEAFGYQIFHSGFVHADPHPGNILVRKRAGNTELVLLDHGLYQKISNNEITALSNMWQAMVLSDHNNMEKYSKMLGVQDYEMFAEILAQAPLKTNNFRLKPKLTEEDLKLITEFAQRRFDSVMSCLKAMPRNLLFVVRNLNTIRAICHSHGDPIDRYSVLARAAMKSTHKSRGILGKLALLPKWTYYEYKLAVTRFTSWLKHIFIKNLITLGLIPDARKIMADIL